MATKKLHIVDTDDGLSDGIAQTPNKEKIGRAWQNEAPQGYFITLQLDKHWIITDEEYKLLNKYKRQ